MTRAVHTASDDEGMDEIERAMEATARGLIFANLVDFDTQFGHRNDVAGYAANLERFDLRLPRLLPQLRDRDILVVTADHGNDPTTPSTDHSREYVPVMVVGRRGPAGRGHRHARDLRRPRPDGRRPVRRGPLPNGHELFADIISREGLDDVPGK